MKEQILICGPRYPVENRSQTNRDVTPLYPEGVEEGKPTAPDQDILYSPDVEQPKKEEKQ